MNKDFSQVITDNIKPNTDTKDDSKTIVDTEDNKQAFILERKTSDKTSKRAFNITMDDELIKELDKIAKKTNYSRNELISKMCEFCTKNIEIRGN